MEKLLFFAKILSEEIYKEYYVFYDERYDRGYKILDFSSDYLTYEDYEEHRGGTMLRMKNNQYIILEPLREEMEFEDLLCEVQTEEQEMKLEEFTEDYGTEEEGKLIGILFPTVYLYEILYDFGMLGERFHDEKKDRSVEMLLKAVNKLASVFDFDLHFLDGRIYITTEKKESEDHTYICRNMMEVEFVYQLKNGVKLKEARESSGMSEEEFEDFMEQLSRHQWRQTKAYQLMF